VKLDMGVVRNGALMVEDYGEIGGLERAFKLVLDSPSLPT
jgi:hypothetical protein